jgi:hypothetical protein
VRILSYQPSRRGLLRALSVAAFGVPLLKLGHVLDRRRVLAPEDLAPIPWIGHC